MNRGLFIQLTYLVLAKYNCKSLLCHLDLTFACKFAVIFGLDTSALRFYYDFGLSNWS